MCISFDVMTEDSFPFTELTRGTDVETSALSLTIALCTSLLIRENSDVTELPWVDPNCEIYTSDEGVQEL
jgi:hypothetical protein